MCVYLFHMLPVQKICSVVAGRLTERQTNLNFFAYICIQTTQMVKVLSNSYRPNFILILRTTNNNFEIIFSFGDCCFSHLHPTSYWHQPKIPSTTLATNCPHATIAMLVETRRPLSLAGEHSARYMGIVVEVRPG